MLSNSELKNISGGGLATSTVAAIIGGVFVFFAGLFEGFFESKSSCQA